MVEPVVAFVDAFAGFLRRTSISCVVAFGPLCTRIGDSFFVRLVDDSPDVNWVKTTNFADIGMAVNGSSAVIFTAIDNLVKGAAGQAVQNMNLMFGFEEATGLMLAGSNP